MDEKTLKYLPTHEWIEPSGARRKVGISRFAQEQLGDIVFVEMPPIGRSVAAGDELAVIESCKATSGVYAPLAGKVVAVNERLAHDPGHVNSSPYGDGWLFELEVPSGADESTLLDHSAYEKHCSEAG